MVVFSPTGQKISMLGRDTTHPLLYIIFILVCQAKNSYNFLYCIYYKKYCIQWTQTALCILYKVYCIQRTSSFTYSIYYIVYIKHYFLYCIQYTLNIIYLVYSILYTINHWLINCKQIVRQIVNKWLTNCRINSCG